MARYVIQTTDQTTGAVGLYRLGRASEWYERHQADAAFADAVAIGAAGLMVELLADGDVIARRRVER